jgi:hypothetical protein
MSKSWWESLTPVKRRGRPPKNALSNAPEWVTSSAKPKKKRTFTEQAKRMKAYWKKLKAKA